MPDNTQARLAKLQKLRKAYTAGLAERLAGIAQCWALVRQSPEDSSNVRELHRQVHSMAGSAGTFGYRRLGQAARNLEKIISEADELALTEIAQADDIQSRLDGLQLIADSGPEVAEQTELIQMQAPPRAGFGPGLPDRRRHGAGQTKPSPSSAPMDGKSAPSAPPNRPARHCVKPCPRR